MWGRSGGRAVRPLLRRISRDGQGGEANVRPANIAPAAGAPIRVPAWAYPAITLASLLLGATNLVRGTSALTSIGDSDLTNFFFKSATYILNGDPWHMYAVRATVPVDTYPNYNPPLSMFLMAPLIGLAHAFGIPTGPQGTDGTGPNGALITFVAMPFIILIPLLGYVTLWALRRMYPEMPETQRLLAFLLVTLSPLAWQSISPWYHLEQPLMLCFLIVALIALQQRQTVLAGILAGLAVLTRTTALIPLIALGVLLLAERDWRGLVRLGGVGGGIAAVGLAPFFLFDPANAMYSFVSWRGTAIIGGNSIWTIFSSTPLDNLARRLDFYAVVAFVAAVAWLAARRFGITAYSREAWAVVAIAALAVPLLSKTIWPYYFLEPFVLLLIWEFASMHDRRAGLWRWPVLSTSFLAVAATLSQYIWLRSTGPFDRIAVGLLEFAAMLAFVFASCVRVLAAKPGVSGEQAMHYPLAPPAYTPNTPAAPNMTPMTPDIPLAPMPPAARREARGGRRAAQQVPQQAPPSAGRGPGLGRAPLWPGEQPAPNQDNTPRPPWGLP